jgi:putative restriction endonuclease
MNDLRSTLLGIRQYHASGQRAPHKPLLILMALAQFDRTGSSELAWPAVEEQLGKLLDEFGVPKRGPQLPSYPFTRLRADGIWRLSADVPDDLVTPLREQLVVGRFTEDVEAELRRDPVQVPALARAVVEAQFTASIADDVLAAVGFDPESCGDGVRLTAAPGRRRSTAWREQIMLAWNRSCAFCGFDGVLGGAAVGIEAAHVRWFNFDGPDELDNGMALCSLHHKLFDRGALGLSNGRIVVSSYFTANTEAGRRTYELHDVELQPRPGTRMPAASHIEWHTTQVFKGLSLTP